MLLITLCRGVRWFARFVWKRRSKWLRLQVTNMPQMKYTSICKLLRKRDLARLFDLSQLCPTANYTSNMVQALWVIRETLCDQVCFDVELHKCSSFYIHFLLGIHLLGTPQWIAAYDNVHLWQITQEFHSWTWRRLAYTYLIFGFRIHVFFCIVYFLFIWRWSESYLPFFTI